MVRHSTTADRLVSQGSVGGVAGGPHHVTVSQRQGSDGTASRLRADGPSWSFQRYSDLSGYICDAVTVVWGQGQACKAFGTNHSVLQVLFPLVSFQRSPWNPREIQELAPGHTAKRAGEPGTEPGSF